jgi:peroxiredoxin
MRRLLRALVLPAALLSVASFVTSPLTAQPAPMLGPVDGKDLAPTDIERVAVGQPAPDFALARYGGGTLRLSQYRGQKNVVLVFYRGHWCPYCITQLKELRTLLDAELRKDAELLVISIDGDAETRMAVARIASDGVQPDFTFLSDPDHAVIDRYGVLNPSGSRRGIPHPAAYVIDKQGVVRWRDVQTDYKVRPTNAAILTALKQVNR